MGNWVWSTDMCRMKFALGVVEGVLASIQNLRCKVYYTGSYAYAGVITTELLLTTLVRSLRKGSQHVSNRVTVEPDHSTAYAEVWC